MNPAPTQIPRAQLLAIVDRAIAEGRHSPDWPGTVCAGCGQWRHMWWANEQGKSFCRECSPKDRFELAQDAARAQRGASDAPQ